jgi:hypothetical protein
MNNDELISKLSLKNCPVKVVRLPYKSLLQWLGLSFLWLALIMSLIGVRKDFYHIFKDVTFILYCSILLGLAVSSAYSSLSFSIPDKHSRILYWTPYLSLVSWVLVLLLSVNDRTSSNFEDGFLCMRDILIFSSIPAFVLFRNVKQGSVLQTSITGIFCILGSGGLGALATQLTCQDSFGFHHLLWHVPSVVSLGLLGFFIGKKLKVY